MNRGHRTTSFAIGTITVGMLSRHGISGLEAEQLLVSLINSINFFSLISDTVLRSELPMIAHLPIFLNKMLCVYVAQGTPYRRNDATLFRAIYARN